MLQFTSINNHERGVLYSLLMQSYSIIIKADPIHWKIEESNWIEFDRDVFDNLGTIGSCVFLSWYEGKLIGFGSFDPRQKPALGIIGHNCIVPKYRGQGFGKKQIVEILRRFGEIGIRKAQATTNDNSYFVPARKMYESCGFKEADREPWENDPKQKLIHYQKSIG